MIVWRPFVRFFGLLNNKLLCSYQFSRNHSKNRQKEEKESIWEFTFSELELSYEHSVNSLSILSISLLLFFLPSQADNNYNYLLVFGSVCPLFLFHVSFRFFCFLKKYKIKCDPVNYIRVASKHQSDGNCHILHPNWFLLSFFSYEHWDNKCSWDITFRFFISTKIKWIFIRETTKYS